MKGRSIPMWPLMFTIPALFIVAAVWLGYLTAFVDDRWGDLAQGAVFLAAFAFVAPVVAGAAEARIPLPSRKPRGWRKIRREKEEEAYIQRLEKELGL